VEAGKRAAKFEDKMNRREECRIPTEYCKKGRESKNPDITGSMRGVWQRIFRSTWGRESAKERKIMARFRRGNEERESRYWMEGEERRCRMCYEEKETNKHMWNGCNEMRERERKERREITNEDGREIGWMKEIWKRSDRMEKERGADRKKNLFFLELSPLFLDKTVNGSMYWLSLGRSS
jgi:hypothetical protein